MEIPVAVMCSTRPRAGACACARLIDKAEDPLVLVPRLARAALPEQP